MKKTKIFARAYTSGITTPHKILFCGSCGEQLLAFLIGAENYRDCYESGCYTPYSHSPYNRETGKRQWVYSYVCPKYKKWADRRHDKFIREEIITE